MAASSPSVSVDDRPYSVAPEQVQRLPFRVRLARDERDLKAIAALRALTYGRHIPGMSESVAQPEEEDFRPEVLLVMAESLATGQLLGSLRLIHNRHQALKLEQDFPLPPGLRHHTLAETSRLTVRPHPESRMASLALMKVAYEACAASGIDDIIITARSPMDRVYRAMCFDDLLDGHKIPFPPVAHIPHGVYLLPIEEADRRWRESACPMYGFMARTVHPDIQVGKDEVRARFGDVAAARNTADARHESMAARSGLTLA